MLIEIKNPSNYNTELYNSLVNLPRNILFNGEHKLREPLGIYSISITRVFKAFENILNEIENSKVDLAVLDLAHKELLDSIMAFIDDGYLIMKCFYPKSRVPDDIIFTDKWLKRVDNSLIEKHKKNIFPYRKKIAQIVNKTKHNQARYCHVEFSSMHGKVMGYYIEGITEDGIIQPNKDIHPDWNGVYTAISYNKDIRQQLVNVYCIAKHIANTVRKIILKNHKININVSTCPYPANNRIIEIFNRVSLLENLFFPDEYNENLPQLIIEDNYIQIRTSVYKKYLSKLPRPTNGKINVVMTADGVTRSWALPYYFRKK